MSAAPEEEEHVELVSLFQKLEIDVAPPLAAMAQVAHALGNLLQESRPGKVGIRIEAVEYVEVARAIECLTSFLVTACKQRGILWPTRNVDANSVQDLIFRIHAAQAQAGSKPTLVGIKRGDK